MSATPNQGNQPSGVHQSPPATPNFVAGVFTNPGYGTKNTVVLGSNLSVGGGISINIADNSQVITGDGMTVNVARANPVNKQEESTSST